MSATAQLFKEIGPIKLAAIGFIGFLLLASFLFLAVKMSNPALAPLFSGLEPGDSNKIVSQLEGMGVYYEVAGGGSQIMVPAKKVNGLRMTMAKDGLPSGNANIGYELFDKNDSMGVSSFVHNVNFLRALEGELGRTISSFQSVDSARVHLVIPKKSMFSRSKEEPSASVVLKVRGGKTMDQSEISAVANLVATAVPGLKVAKVTIVDTQGRPFKKGGADENDPGVMASNSEQFRVQFESRMKGVIENLLQRSVGMGKVEAEVSAEMDFDREVTDSEIYDPNGQVARSVQTVEESGKSSDSSGGSLGAAGNLPEGEAGLAMGAASNSSKVDEITNFEISKTIKKHIKETGVLKKLSIAVLVDGDYEYDEENDIYNYVPRADDELKKIESLVKSAVGFNEQRGDKIDVINMKFSNEVQGTEKEKPFEWLTRDLGSIVQTLIIGIVVILVILLIVKPMVGKAFEITKSDTEDADIQKALAQSELEELEELTGEVETNVNKAEPLIDIDRFEEKKNSSSLGAINNIVDRHPEEAVTIIRNWLEEDASA